MTPGATNVLVMVGFAAVVLVPVLVFLATALRRAKRETNAAWAAFAASRDMTFSPSRGFWTSWSSARLEGAVGGVSMSVDAVHERVGESVAKVMRVRARLSRAQGLDFAVWPAGERFVPRTPPPAPSLFAGEPTPGPVVTAFDPAFDAAFTVVSSADATRVAALLHPEARVALVSFAAGGLVSLVCTDGVIELCWFGTIRDPGRLSSALQLAATVTR